MPSKPDYIWDVHIWGPSRAATGLHVKKTGLHVKIKWSLKIQTEAPNSKESTSFARKIMFQKQRNKQKRLLHTRDINKKETQIYWLQLLEFRIQNSQKFFFLEDFLYIKEGGFWVVLQFVCCFFLVFFRKNRFQTFMTLWLKFGFFKSYRKARVCLRQLAYDWNCVQRIVK